MTRPRLIGIHGKARSGKDTVANFLVENHFFFRYAFADPIRGFVARLTGIPLQDLIDGDIKDQIYEPFGCTPRYMMQTLGTEWGRNLICHDIWVKAMETKWEEVKHNNVAMVVPDIRFDNEADIVRKLGGEVWIIHRSNTPKVESHASEAGISPTPEDLLIINNGTINDLYDTIDDIIFPPPKTA